LAFWLAKLAFNVPLLVTGEPDTENTASGSERPTLETVPPPPPFDATQVQLVPVHWGN
jgi:hypothetical protein